MGKNAQIVTQLAASIRSIAREQSAVLKPVSETIKKLTNQSFNLSKSPEGNPFDPLADKSGRKPIIGIRDSLSYQVANNKIVASTDKGYLKYQQTGTRKMAQRNPFPDGTPSESWNRAVSKSLYDALLRRLYGKRP